MASKFHNQYKKLGFCLIQKSAFPTLPSSLEGEAKFKKLLNFVFSQCVYLGMVEGDGGEKKKKWSHLQHFLHLTAFLPDSKLRISVLLYYVFKEPPHIYCLPKGRPEWHFLCLLFTKLQCQDNKCCGWSMCVFHFSGNSVLHGLSSSTLQIKHYSTLFSERDTSPSRCLFSCSTAEELGRLKLHSFSCH